jgi:hypothetical protein
MKPIERSKKLDGVCYDIRGPVAREAKRMEEEGHRILKLNIGNPAPFGFEAPDEILTCQPRKVTAILRAFIRPGLQWHNITSPVAFVVLMPTTSTSATVSLNSF